MSDSAPAPESARNRIRLEVAHVSDSAPAPESARNRIRRATLGTGFTPKCEVVEWNGEKIEVRKVSIGQQRNINKLSTRTAVATDEEGKKVVTETVDAFKLTVLSVIYSCFVPGTDERVFDEGDQVELLKMADDGFMEPLLAAVSKVNKKPPPPAKGEEEEVLKNSART